MKVWTYETTPFALGGTRRPIATEIDEFERIKVGKGFHAVVMQNPVNKYWHVFLDGCGALIGTDKNKAKLIRRVKQDVKTGNKVVMLEQEELGAKEQRQATILSTVDFFSKFRG